MSEEYGWGGKILWVDLDKKQIEKQPIPLQWKKQFIGGRGINMKILFDNLKAETDPLSPGNVFIQGTGPLTGTLVGGRTESTGRSPLTGFLGDANAGGHWGAELKFAGYDHVVFTGQSDKPVYLWVDDDTVELRDAADLWGKNVWEMTDIIRKRENDPNIQVLGIGQAGENLVKFACVMNTYARASGRTGLGAVLGSKKVKCIACRGTKGVKIARPKEFLELIKKIYDWSVNSEFYEWYPKYGTSMLTEHKNMIQTLPVKNWTLNTLPDVDKTSGKTFHEKFTTKNRACNGCFFHCDHFFKAGDIQGPGVEYETMNAFGLRSGNFTSIPTILECANLSNQYGLDVVSAGGTLALAMDLYERGMLTKKDTDGIELTWGNREAMLQCIHKIVFREGFGDLLAEGPYLMAQQIGGDAPSRVVHFKGMCPTSVEIRQMKAWALGYATSTVGATHVRGILKAEGMQATKEQVIELFGTADVMDPVLYDTVGKPKGVQYYQRLATLCDCLEICLFNTFWCGYPTYHEHLHELFNAATGLDIELDDFISAADRTWLLEMAINTREGYTWEDDMPCERFQTDPLSVGKYKGEVLEPEPFKEMLKAYYKLVGADPETGRPDYDALVDLSMPEVAEELVALGKIPETKEAVKQNDGN
jgi:aldehyde:ferredoxin oxidoreductase